VNTSAEPGHAERADVAVPFRPRPRGAREAVASRLIQVHPGPPTHRGPCGSAPACANSSMAELVGEAVRSDRLTWTPPRVTDRDPRSVGIHIYRGASELIINALWHPRASASWCHVPECVDECMRASFDSGVSGGCLAEWACADSRERLQSIRPYQTPSTVSRPAEFSTQISTQDCGSEICRGPIYHAL
jgi:hypothetical protein